MNELQMNTCQGIRLVHFSYYKGRVVVDIRSRTHTGDWMPHSELVMTVADWNRFIQKANEYDVELELTLEEK